MLWSQIFLANLNQVLNHRLWGNTVQDYLVFLLLFGVSLLLLRLFRNIGIQKIAKIAKKTKNEVDNLVIQSLKSLPWFLYALIAFWVACRFLLLPTGFYRYFNFFLLVVVVYCLVRISEKFIDYGTQKLIQEKEKKGEKPSRSFANLVNKILRGLLWLIAILLILQNLGFQITSLIASLGIGGIAIAFALQAVLSDFFAYFSIHFDKPFQIGDFIVTENDMGVIKKIGLRSTRLQSLSGEEIVVSNQELTAKRIHNYKKMKERRVQFQFGVEYQTSTAKLEKIPSLVREIIEGIEDIQLDRVHFKEFGDFSLIFEVVYLVSSPDYNQYMDIGQKINLALKRKLEEEKIEFAYPTQTVFLRKNS